jgi:hypothetical protein
MESTRWTKWIEGLPGLLTLFGVLLFIALSVPANIFYTVLQSNAQTAGITYTALLTGSTLGVTAIVTFGTLILLSVAAVISFAQYLIRILALQVEYRRLPFDHTRSLPQEHDDHFQAYLVFLRKYFDLFKLDRIHGISFEEYKARIVRRDELMRVSKSASAQTAELDELKKWPLSEVPNLNMKMLVLSGARGLTRNWLRRHARMLVILFSILAVVGLLPLSALQAYIVKGGREDLGSKMGLFAYSADPVSMTPVLKDHSAAIDVYVQKQLFLLGQNGQQVVLYSPADDRSITLPVNSVMITSR